MHILQQHANIIRLRQKTAAKSNIRGLELRTILFILMTETIIILMTGFLLSRGDTRQLTIKCMGSFIINIATKSHVKPERRPHSVSTAWKKGCRSPRCTLSSRQQRCWSLWKRCEDTVQSPRTPCGGVYFKHAQNKRRGLAFAHRVRQLAMGSSRAPWARCKDAV